MMTRGTKARVRQVEKKALMRSPCKANFIFIFILADFFVFL